MKLALGLINLFIIEFNKTYCLPTKTKQFAWTKNCE